MLRELQGASGGAQGGFKTRRCVGAGLIFYVHARAQRARALQTAQDFLFESLSREFPLVIQW